MPPRALLLVLSCGFAGLSSAAAAQDPSSPPPPSGKSGSAGSDVLELLPDIGKIGAEVAVFGGPSWNPYEVGQGVELGGYIDLPLRRLAGGKVSYEIFQGLSLATSDPFVLTLPIGHASVRTRLRILHASPFSLKYALMRMGRLRPYLNAGADVLVVISEQERTEGGPLLPQSPELEERGLPAGQGNIELGGHAAAGCEIRVSAGLSLNLEYRFTTTGKAQGQLHGASAALGFHW